MNKELAMTTEMKVEDGKFSVVGFESYKSNLITILNGEYDIKQVDKYNYDIAKAKKAELNKLSKALDSRRLDYQKKYLEPFNYGKAQYDELIAMINNASNKLNEQIKTIDEEYKKEKRQELLEYFKTLKCPVLLYSCIEDEKWYNKSTPIQKAKLELENKVIKIKNDVDHIYEDFKDNEEQFSMIISYYVMTNGDYDKALEKAAEMTIYMNTFKLYLSNRKHEENDK